MDDSLTHLANTCLDFQAQSASRAAESMLDAGDSKSSAKEAELEKKVKAVEEGKLDLNSRHM